MQTGYTCRNDTHTRFRGGPDGTIHIIPGNIRIAQAAQDDQSNNADDADEARGEEDGRQGGPVAGGRAEALEVGQREDDDKEVDGGVEAADDELDGVAVGAVAWRGGVVAEPEVGDWCAGRGWVRCGFPGDK